MGNWSLKFTPIINLGVIRVTQKTNKGKMNEQINFSTIDKQKEIIGSGMSGGRRIACGKDEWLTPPEIIQELGVFDLDPCSPIKRPWDTAKKHLTINDDGLTKEWEGRVWLNPPYGAETGKWLNKLSKHGNGVALVFARTETKDWQLHIWQKAHAVFFIFGRLYFHHVDGIKAKTNSGAPSALVAYGLRNVDAIEGSRLSGELVRLR